MQEQDSNNIDADDKQKIKKTRIKIFLWVSLLSAVFAFIPFFLIAGLMSHFTDQSGTVYSILFLSNFLVFYGISMITYSNKINRRNRMQDRNRL